MKRSTKLAAALAAGVAAVSTLGMAAAADAAGPGRRTCGTDRFRSTLEVVGLTADTRLICFTEHKPGSARDIGRVTGLVSDTRLVGIDARAATGELIGLGEAGGVYALNPATAAATKKAQLDVALSGTSFGVDVNPTVDRLRIVSDTGQNLRANMDTGATLTDVALNSAPGVVATGIVGAAYTNNDADPNTATTLFDIDSALDQVSVQAPPNNGGLNPTGKLGIDAGPAVGADIYSVQRNGSTVDNQAFASVNTGTRTGFYEVSLLTGKVSSKGSFASRNAVIGIAIPLAQS
jgi:hypothetical protein